MNNPRNAVSANIRTSPEAGVNCPVSGDLIMCPQPKPARSKFWNVIGRGSVFIHFIPEAIAKRYRETLREGRILDKLFRHSQALVDCVTLRVFQHAGAIFIILLSGCSINKLIPPPYAGAVIEHSRFFGLSAAYQGYGVKVGWGSEVWELIPVSTNKLYAGPISDTFKLGQNLNPFSTTIIEDVQAFSPDSQPPAPRFGHLFDPKTKTPPVP